MQSLTGRENLHHLCRQKEVSEQKDGNHAEVSSQGRPLAQKQVKLAIFKKVRSTNATLKTPKRYFE